MFIVTLGFLAFMAVSLLAYYLVPFRFQWPALLGISFIFFFLAGTPFTIVYLLAAIVVTWYGACYIEKHRSDKKKCRRALWLSIIVVAGLLTALKYSNFFLNNCRSVLNLLHIKNEISTVSWAASLGISYYSLQAIGYITDVYWGTSRAQGNLGKIALFVSFFPQMSSGPISRYEQLGEQLWTPHKFSYQNLTYGAQRILFGFIKKLVIAENLAICTSKVFGADAHYNGIFMWGCVAAYVCQLYCDFSGCMDIVIGSAQCFGIEMQENFDRPFHAESIQKFWKRWHITLGGWVQDYIMYPLLRTKAWNKMRKTLKKKVGKGASRNVPTYIAMFILWFYMGLWHGGEWHYVAQGVFFFLVIMLGQLMEPVWEKLYKKTGLNPENKIWRKFQSVRTAVIFATGVIFFKAKSVMQALSYIKACISPKCIFSGNFFAQMNVFKSGFQAGELKRIAISVLIGYLIVLVLIFFQSREKSVYDWMAKRNIVLRWIMLYVMLFAVILLGVYGPGFAASEFIYGGF